MEISTTKVKQYSSKYKNVLLIDGVPVCITRGHKSLNDCISYLLTGEPKLRDGKIMRILEKYRKGGAKMDGERRTEE